LKRESKLFRICDCNFNSKKQTGENMTEEQNSNEWQAPPLPELIKKEEPEMSEVATLFNIFIEPGRTFEDLRRKPRFLLATLIISILTTAYVFGLYYKVGDEGYRRFVLEQINKSPQADSLTSEQKNNAVNMQMTVGNVVRYIMPVFVIISIAFGALLYWLGGKIFGGTGNYLHAVSVWVYSTLPPAIVSSLASVAVFILKSADEIDIAASQRGLVQANLSVLFDGKAMPVLVTLISVLDLFAIWGWVLAAIGLQKTNKISSGSAWAITIILALVMVAVRVIGAVFSGNVS
jgi:Yip1 domain